MSNPTPQEQIVALQSELIQVRQASDRTPESADDRRSAECEVLGKLGIAYYQGQQWSEAIATLREYLNLALELGQQWHQAVAHYYLGFAQQAIEESEQAVAAFVQGYRLFRQLQKSEFAAQLWQQLVKQGQRYVQNQQFPEAVALYKQQIQVLLEFDNKKDSAEIAIELGKVYYYQQDFTQAIACYASVLDSAQILKESALENAALAWLGCSYWQSGDLEQGLQYLEQRLALVQQLENRAAQQETLPWLIQICQKLDYPDKVIQFYQLQANLWQQQGDAVNHYLSLYELATYQFNRQQYPEALSGFQVALELAETLSDEQGKPWKTASSHYMLGQCYRNLGENQPAISHYEPAVQLYLELGGKDWAKKGLDALLQLYRNTQQSEAELSCQKQRLDLFRQEGDAQWERYCLYQIGFLYYNQEQWEKALEYFDLSLSLAQKLELKEAQADAYYMLGQCQRNLGQKEAAISAYQQAVELYGELGIKNWLLSGLEYLVNLHQELNQYEEAISCHKRRLEIFQQEKNASEEQSCLYKIGSVYNKQEQWKNALEYFELALQLARDLSQTYKQANAHYMMGMSYQNLNRQEAAILAYQEAVNLYLEVEVKDWAANGLNYIGYLCRSLQRYEEAIKAQEQRLGLLRELGERSSEQSCLDDLGRLYYDLKQWERSLEYFELALQLAVELEQKRNQANAHYMLGLCYEGLGNLPLAEESNLKAKSLYQSLGDNKWEQICQDNLSRLAPKTLADDSPDSGFGEEWLRQQILQDVFWSQLRQTEAQSGGNEAAVHQVMRENMELIVPALGDIIAQWLQVALTQQPDQAELLADVVENTCTSIILFPYGRYAEVQEIAIRGYDVVLQLRVDNPEKRAQTLTNLGSARATQAQMGIDRAENLQKAIKAYNEAAEIRRRLGLETDLSTTLTNLGVARRTQAEMGIEPAENLQKAINAYNQAAEIRRQPGLETDLSSTLNNLGSARLAQAQMGIEPAENLQKAIKAYNQAAEILQQPGLEKDLSSTLTNLGSARLAQAQMGIEPAENLQKAIDAYNEAAEILQQPGLEKDLSHTLTNLGSAHATQARMGLKPAENLQKAIKAYNQAAEILQQPGLEKDLSTALNNLGSARVTQAQMGIEPAENLQKAIKAYNQATEILRQLGLEKDFSTTLTNLGSAHATQAEMGINPAENLQQAIKAYNQAAEILRQPGLEKDLSTTLTNLGSARLAQAEMGIDQAENLQKAIKAYNEAAEIRRQLGLARDLASTLNNFGFAYQAQSRLAENSFSQQQAALENAYRSFQAALEQVEYLRGEIGANSEGYKRNFNEEWNKVYRGMVEVCLELGRYTDAIEYADRSKARNLVELMATRDAYPGGVIPENIRQRLQQLKIVIAQEERRLQQETKPDYTHLNQMRQEKQQLDPYKPLHFQAMQELLDKETAILEWYILGDKFLTFTITRQKLYFWQSSPEDFKNLIDWINAYLNDYRRNKEQWQNHLPQRLEQLAQILHLDEILQNLREKFPKCQKLILIPHRFLHLFPLHALPVAAGENQRQTLQELFPKGVNYAPNCQVLQQAQKRINQRPDFNELFAIQNPTQDLHFTDIEVAAIQSLFNPHHILEYEAAEKAAILDGDNLKNAHCTHFSCHGYFNFEDALKSALILAKSEFTPPPPSEDPSRYIPQRNGKLLDLSKCLTIEDILRLDLSNCRLVTLSACETGITDFTSTSDEYIGLPSGFILAGSPNVVCSLWAVNDLSTALLMIRFYQNVKKGETVTLALKHAQIWLRDATAEALQQWSSQLNLRPTYRQQLRRFSTMEATAKPFASPYYWAGFCAIGA